MGRTSPPTPSNPGKGLGLLQRHAVKKDVADKAKDAADKARMDQKPPTDIGVSKQQRHVGCFL